MTPRSLREQLERLEQPFDVDDLRRLMHELRRTAERERDGLRERVPMGVGELAEATAAAQRRADEVEAIDERTRGGLLGTLLASADSSGVEQRRAEANRTLAGDLAVLERRIEDAHALAAQVQALVQTSEYGLRVLDGLKPRAAAAEVPASEVATIDRARAGVASLPDQVLRLPAALDAPMRDALAVTRHAVAVLTRLRSTGRASTVSEALLDGVVSPDSGALGQTVRKKAADAGWVPGTEEESRTAGEAAASVASERAEARGRARRDAEARVAAMAELDALEPDGW